MTRKRLSKTAKKPFIYILLIAIILGTVPYSLFQFEVAAESSNLSDSSDIIESVNELKDSEQDISVTDHSIDKDESDEDDVKTEPEENNPKKNKSGEVSTMADVVVTTEGGLKKAIGDGTGEKNIVLGADITLDEFIWINPNNKISLTTQNEIPYTISINPAKNIRHFSFENDVTLEIGKNVTLKGNSTQLYDGSGGINIYGASEVILSGGAIQNCNNFDGSNFGAGGAIYGEDSSIITINSGTISNCYSANQGGAISTSGTISSIKKLTIENCQSGGAGGAINSQKSNGASIMGALSNLTIKNCSSMYDAGGAINAAGTLGDFDNVTITSCAAVRGGALNMNNNAVSSKNFNINNTNISKCKSTVGNGGAINVDGSYYTISFANTSIDECTSADKGGGVYFNGGENLFKFNNQAIVTNCEAVDDGGGIYSNNCQVVLDGAEITNCKAKAGGGICGYWGSAELVMNNGEISHCTSDTDGGGIYSYDMSITLKDGSVKNCTAISNGGGIFTTNYSNLSTSAIVTFSDNIAKYYRQLATNVQYSNISANSISLTSGENGALDIFTPLNNFDINYQSFSVVYDPTSGTAIKGGDPPNTIIYELKLWMTKGSILSNTNEYFDYILTDAAFSHWSDGNGKDYAGDSDFIFSDNIDLEATDSQPTFNLFAQWDGDLTISKKVIGDYADKTKSFNIKIKITDSDDNDITEDIKTSDPDLDIEGGEGTVQLKDGESIELFELPITYKYSVTEEDPSPFNVSYYLNDDTTSKSSISAMTLVKNTMVTVQNEYEDVVITDADVDNLLMMLSIILACMAVWMIYGYRTQSNSGLRRN